MFMDLDQKVEFERDLHDYVKNILNNKSQNFNIPKRQILIFLNGEI